MTEWRDELNQFFVKTEVNRVQKESSELESFITTVVMPAFEDLAKELEKHGRTTVIRNAVISAALIVQNNGEEEMAYRILGRVLPNAVVPYVDLRFRERKGLRYLRTELMFRGAGTHYRLMDITRDEIIKNFLDNYMRRVKPL
jgi:choline/glycine/proline betaine transport protein